MSGYQNRASPKDGVEDFPTPPWATRALIRVLREFNMLSSQETVPWAVWEPAANRGYMARPLSEVFSTVIATDVQDYGMGYPVIDFLDGPTPKDHGMDVHWIITNPPFNRADKFVRRALDVADHGVALFVRSAFAEGMGRYQSIFKKNPPTLIAQFVERVPIVRGRVDPTASTAMPYAWFIWDMRQDTDGTAVHHWIAPCRKEMERDGDYDAFGTESET